MDIKERIRTNLQIFGGAIRIIEKENISAEEKNKRLDKLLETHLQTLIDFYKEVSEVHEKIMDEKCASDEIHCTCVPVLREEIKRLRQTLIDSTKKEKK